MRKSRDDLSLIPDGLIIMYSIINLILVDMHVSTTLGFYQLGQPMCVLM